MFSQYFYSFLKGSELITEQHGCTNINPVDQLTKPVKTSSMNCKEWQ